MALRDSPPRILLWVTSLLLIALAIGLYVGKPQLPTAIPISTRGQPTLGYTKAPVQVVIFSEPKCPHCKEFSQKVFPVLKRDFIDTYKVRCTLIPISFFPGSLAASNAALCVYYENALYPNDELFFKYMDTLYKYQSTENNDWLSEESLIKFAKLTSPAIKINRLKKGIERETYRIQIEKNTHYAETIMDGTLAVPSVYVNGIKVPDVSLEGIRKLIIEVLEFKGAIDAS